MNNFQNVRTLIKHTSQVGNFELQKELEDLLALVPVPVLRDYKGAIFDGEYWEFNGWHYDTVAQLIYENRDTFSDEDFVQLWELKLIPYVVDNRPKTTVQLKDIASKQLIEELEGRGIHNQWKYEEEPKPEPKVAKSWWENLKEDYEH